MKTKKPKRGFLDGYKTYDTSQGFASRREWVNSFRERLGFEKATEVLGEKDPMTLFGLTASATWEEIVSTYLKLAMKNHPDKGGDKVVMQKINAAFEVLKKRFGK